MKVGDYVKTHTRNPVHAFVLDFATWIDDHGPYEMIELLAETGEIMFLAADGVEIIDEKEVP